MKSFAAVFGVGLVALMLQGALARTIPPPWCPDLAWLVVVALGLRWPRMLSGVVLAVGLGYAADLVSGSLLGQHALLRLLTFLAAAVAGRQLDLSGALPIALFVFAMTWIYGLAVVGVLSFLVGTGGIGWQVLGDAFVHAGVNVLAIGPVLSGVERLLLRLSDEDIARRGPLPLGLHRRSVG